MQPRSAIARRTEQFSSFFSFPLLDQSPKRAETFSEAKLLFSIVTFWLYIFQQRKPWCRQASSCFYLKHVIEALKLIFMDALRSFSRFRRIVTCYNWTPNDAVESLSCLQICCDPMMLHKCDEISLRVTRISVSRTPTWEMALTKIPFCPFPYYTGIVYQLIDMPIDSKVTKSNLKGDNDIEFSMSWFQ